MKRINEYTTIHQKRSPRSKSTKLCDESRQHISKITKNKTVDYKIKCKTYSNIPKQHAVWLILLKKILHIFSDTETVFLKSLARYFRSIRCIIIFSIFLGTLLENHSIMKQRQILKSFKNKYA